MTVLNQQAVNSQVTNTAYFSRNKFATDADYQTHQASVLGANLSWPNPSIAHFYYNTTTHKMRVYNLNTLTWEDAGGGGSSIFFGTSTFFTPAVGQQIYIDALGLYRLGVASIDGELSVGTITKVISATTFEFAHSGLVACPAHGFTIGQEYYQDLATAGAVTTTVPTSGYNRPAFQVVDVNNLFILNSMRPLQVSTGLVSTDISTGATDAGKLVKTGSDGRISNTFNKVKMVRVQVGAQKNFTRDVALQNVNLDGNIQLENTFLGDFCNITTGANWELEILESGFYNLAMDFLGAVNTNSSANTNASMLFYAHKTTGSGVPTTSNQELIATADIGVGALFNFLFNVKATKQMRLLAGDKIKLTVGCRNAPNGFGYYIYAQTNLNFDANFFQITQLSKD